MTTPPRPDPEKVQAAIDAIRDRHHPYLEATAFTASEVLDYLRKQGSSPEAYRGLPGPLVIEMRQQDVLDGLLVRTSLWWEEAATERWLLDTARRLGLHNRLVGAPLGIGSRQGTRDRLDRLNALFGTHQVPDEKITRGERASRRTPAAQWRSTHNDTVRTIAATLLDHRDRLERLAHDRVNASTDPDLAELGVGLLSTWLDHLADPPYPPGPGQPPSHSYVTAWCKALDTIIAVSLHTHLPASSTLRAAVLRGHELARRYRTLPGGSASTARVPGRPRRREEPGSRPGDQRRKR